MKELLDHEALKSHIEKSVGDLPALPEVVTKVVGLTDDPNSTANELQAVVSNDQALVSKILRVVNSAYYGTPSTVTSINHAVMILGMRQLRNLVLSLAAMSLVKARAPHMQEHQKAFWAHSFGVGSAAVTVAKRKRVDARTIDDLFTGGLLHDIGRLFLLGYFYDQFAECVRVASERQTGVWHVEKDLIGLTHQEIGAMLGEKWNFPPVLTDIIRHHHGPVPSGDCFVHIACVHLGDYYLGKMEGRPEMGSLPISQEVAEWAGFSDEITEEIIVEVREKVHETEELLGMMQQAA